MSSALAGRFFTTSATCEAQRQRLLQRQMQKSSSFFNATKQKIYFEYNKILLETEARGDYNIGQKKYELNSITLKV